MTDLLDPRDTRLHARTPSGAPQLRPLALGAAVAGVVASGAVLVACMAVGLVGWFASDAGGHGDTRDALRVGADGWLLAHGAQLHLATGAVSATITVVPLGLTLLCAYVAHRLGLWAARTSAVEDAGTVVLGTVVMAGLYGVVALLTAVLSATATAESSLLRAFAGGFAVAVVGGGSGILAGSGDVVEWRSRVPETVRAVLKGALAATLLIVAAAAVLLAVALLLDLGAAANVLSRLHADASGGLLYTALVATVAPNAVLLAGSYLLGPGFAVGTGTMVSPSAVVLGPVPAFPLLAALPAEGTSPTWASALVAVPVLAGLVAAVLVVRRFPAYELGTGAVRGLGSGVVGGVCVTLLVALAGGAVGPGRMADLGADLVPTFVAATVAMGLGGLVGGVAATWWGRRGDGVTD
jgi:uncharacterized protein DUF6350